MQNEKINKTIEKNNPKRLKLIAGVSSALLLLGLGGNIVANKIQDEQRFPDGYHNIPKPELYAKAPNSVIPGVQNETEPEPTLKGPYVEASHSVLVPPGTDQIPEK